MDIVEGGSTVKVHYVAKTNENEIIFNSEENTDPIQFTLGNNEILPAFETAIIGMKKGENKTITIPSDEAFGPYTKELISKIKKEALPKDLSPTIGQQLQLQQPDGSILLVTIIDETDDVFVFDANHPLAGKDIIFSVRLVDIVK